MEETLELEAEGCSCDEGLMIARKTTATKGSLILGCDHHHGMKVGADCSFVIDMHNFSHGGPNKEANPRITKSFSRKGSQRGEKKLMSSNNNATVAADRDTVPLIPATSSPTAMVATSCTPENASAAGSTDLSGSHKVHHQVAITAVAAPETGKFGFRRKSFKRSPPPWLLDPKRILIFFATISSIGTILLIFFTLTTSKMNGDEDS